MKTTISKLTVETLAAETSVLQHCIDMALDAGLHDKNVNDELRSVSMLIKQQRSPRGAFPSRFTFSASPAALAAIHTGLLMSADIVHTESELFTAEELDAVVSLTAGFKALVGVLS